MADTAILLEFITYIFQRTPPTADCDEPLKLHLLLFYPSTWYNCHFFLFHIEIEGKCGWIIGGLKGMLPPPLKLLGGLVPWHPYPPPKPLFLRLCVLKNLVNAAKNNSLSEGFPLSRMTQNISMGLMKFSGEMLFL